MVPDPPGKAERREASAGAGRHQSREEMARAKNATFARGKGCGYCNRKGYRGRLGIYELMAIGVYRRLSEANLVPGRDLAVIGFRESPLAKFLSPALTCFRLSLRDLGIGLAEALLASMPAYEEIYPHGIVHKVWPMELVPGESDDTRPTS